MRGRDARRRRFFECADVSIKESVKGRQRSTSVPCGHGNIGNAALRMCRIRRSLVSDAIVITRHVNKRSTSRPSCWECQLQMPDVLPFRRSRARQIISSRTLHTLIFPLITKRRRITQSRTIGRETLSRRLRSIFTRLSEVCHSLLRPSNTIKCMHLRGNLATVSSHACSRGVRWGIAQTVRTLCRPLRTIRTAQLLQLQQQTSLSANSTQTTR